MAGTKSRIKRANKDGSHPPTLNDDLSQIMHFLHEAEKLKSVMRHSWLSSGRQESTAEHTWRMALMAILLHRRLQKPIDLEHTLKIILIHDLPEVVADDHPAWAKISPGQYSSLEAEGLKQLLQRLPEGIQKEIYDLWEEYEANITPEANLAKALDKLEVVIQHNEADISTWNEKELDRKFNEIHGTKECSYDPLLKELREIVRIDTVSKIRNTK